MVNYVKMGVNAIIRPHRSKYSEGQLPPFFNIPVLGRVPRQRVQFKNPRGLDIVGSYYAPPYQMEDFSCVLYLHGNASCQMEGIFLVPVFVPAGVSVLCFDF
jgi:hypothetical protein